MGRRSVAVREVGETCKRGGFFRTFVAWNDVEHDGMGTHKRPACVLMQKVHREMSFPSLSGK
jgi:hypothetical protein